MRYTFFGLNPGAMTKYPAGVARALERMDPDAAFTFFVDDWSGLDGVPFPERSEFLHRGPPTAARIREAIGTARPDALVTTAQRIPDSAFVSAAREQGVFTCMFQHGLYLPFMKRETSLFIRKARKSLDYVRYAAAIADIHGEPRSRYVRELASVFVSGRPYAEADIDHARLNVDLVLLNGAYWRTFHEAQYGYPQDRQVVVGYPDYDQLPAIESQEQVTAVCYVAQTLVEHGRLAKSALEAFLQELLGALDGKRLIVKLHPASDLELYQELRGQPNVEFTRERLPRATHYVGHYSTYLALVPFLSRSLFLWQLDGHPIPDSIRPAASAVGGTAKALRDFLDANRAHEPDSASIQAWQHYFFRGQAPAYDLAAKQILNALHAT